MARRQTIIHRSSSNGKPEVNHSSDQGFQLVGKNGKIVKAIEYLEECKAYKGNNLFLNDFCQVNLSKNKCGEQLHHGTVKAIAQGDRETRVLLELIQYCECKWNRNDIVTIFGNKIGYNTYLVVPSTSISPIRFPNDCFDDFKENDVCLVFSPKSTDYGYGWIRKYTYHNPVIELVATPSSIWSNSTVSTFKRLFHYSKEKRVITVDRRFLRSIFRPTECGEGDLCSVFCGNDVRKTDGTVNEVCKDNYLVTIRGNSDLKFSRNFQMLNKFERVGDNVYRVPKQLVRKCSIEDSSASDDSTPDVPTLNTSQSNSMNGVLERSNSSKTVEIVPNSDVDGAFCWIDVDDTKEFCKEPEHFGNVFVELSDSGNKIVGVELITACKCTILCDGTYKSTLYRQTPKPRQCIFVPKQHTTTVDFAESNTPLDKGTLCSVFLPSTKKLCLGVCNDITCYGRVNLTMLNTKLAESELRRKSGFVDRVSEEGRPVIEIHQSFVMPVFQTSAVKEDSRCSLYVPYHGIFNGLVVKKNSDTCDILVNDGKINVDDLGVDSTFFFQNNANDASAYIVSAFFLRSCEDNQNSPEDIPCSSKSTSREDEAPPVNREPESEPKYSQKTVTRSAANGYYSANSSSYGKTRSEVANSGHSSTPFRRELPPSPVPSEQPARSRTKHEESRKTEFGHGKTYELEEKESKFEIQDGHNYIGAFCRVDNKDIYRHDTCKEHYGDVFVVLSNGVETVAGVELIVSCGCDHKTDGSFNGVMYLDRPQPMKCQFVPLRKVEPVFLKKDKESECQVGDLCYVYLPHTGKELLFKLHSKSANGRFELQLLSDEKTIDRMSFENSKFMDISYEKKLKLSIHSKFVIHAFRPSDVARGSICKVFVPGKDIIEGFVEKKGLKFSHIRFDYNVVQTLKDLGVDVQYFGRSDYGPEVFKVSIDFLRKTEEGSCVNVAEEFPGSCKPRRSSVDQTDVEMLDLTMEWEHTFHSLSPQSVNNFNNQKLHSGNNNPSHSSSLSVISSSYKVIESNHVERGDFCVISEDHMKLLCDAKSHFGTVFAVLASKKGNPILGIELIETCNCQIVCDGTSYDKQQVLETPRRNRCVFVPLTKVELITFEKNAMSDTNEARNASVDDVCDIFVPSLRRHYYAIVLAVSGGLLRMRIMDSSIRFFPKTYETGYPQVVSQSKENFFIELRWQFVRPVFRPSVVKDGNICNLFIPGQGKFQSLVETSQSDGMLRVVVLEGDIDVKKANIDPSLLKQVAEGTFEVTHQLLFSLVATDQDNGPSAIGEGCKDEEIEPIEIERYDENRPARKYADLNIHLGRHKGIQGHHNSCYMDSLLYSLFLFSSSLDEIFDIGKGEFETLSMKNDFRTLIVNPLRSDKCFVSAGNVMALRKQLEPFLPGVTKEEKDAEELLSVLFSKDFVGRQGFSPMLHLRNVKLEEDQDLFVYQMFVEPEDEKDFEKMKVSIPSIQNLLAQSFVLQGQFFRQDPQYFLMQLPRFGKEKLFSGFYLPIELDISDFSLARQQKCSICDEENAVLRCQNCSLTKSDGMFGKSSFALVKFCEDCFETTHKTERKNHKKDKIPVEYIQNSVNGESYVLDAVICIQTSHYVSFVRTKLQGGRVTWLFFDSMADRIENFNNSAATNVPEVTQSVTIERHLNQMKDMSESERHEYVRNHAHGDELFKRLVQDAYIGVYKQKQTAKETYV